MIILHTDIEWINKKYGNIKFQNGTITFSEDAITVFGYLSSEDVKRFSSAHPASIDIHEDLLKNVVFTNTTLDSTVVSLNLSDCSYVKQFTIRCSQKDNYISWNLSSCSFSYKTKTPTEFKIITAPYIHVISLLDKIGFEMKDESVDFHGSIYTFSETSSPYYSKVVPTNGWENIDGLLSLMTLYTQCPITTVATFSFDSDGNQLVSWKPSKYDMSKEGLRNFELDYMYIGQSNRLRDYLENATWIDISEHDKKELTRAIYTYASSKYLPFPLQFLTIYSILDSFAGNKYGQDPYGVMEKGLMNFGIDIRKIGKSTDKAIKDLGLTLKRDNNRSKAVTNFCDLRNYIMHFMSTTEIEDYLDNAELVSKMKFAVVVILLKKLGFHNCGFKNDWKHLSIME